MSKRKDLTGQCFGNRLVIRDKCIEEDWHKLGKPVPKEIGKYSLCKCLNCGAIIPTDRRNLFDTVMKRCVYCSNIGNHYSVETNRNSWVVNGDVAICNVIYNDKVISFTIDSKYYEKASALTWRISKKKNKYYVVSGSIKKKTMLYIHQMIIGEADEGMEIDHIDGNSLNNRESNLRFVTHQENVDNLKATRIDNSIGIRGISYDKRSHKYTVDFNYHGKRVYFKPWKTIEEAVYCRQCAENKKGMHLVEDNPMAKYYELEDEKTRKEIEEYVSLKIS